MNKQDELYMMKMAEKEYWRRVGKPQLIENVYVFSISILVVVLAGLVSGIFSYSDMLVPVTSSFGSIG